MSSGIQMVAPHEEIETAEARLSARTARNYCGPSPLVEIKEEKPAKLFVDSPLPEQLRMARVFIQFRTENIRILPVFGRGAVDVSPRIGHLHITVDDAPWHFVQASEDTVVVVGLKPGPHRVLLELADPTHQVITSRIVEFIVPEKALEHL